MDARTSYDAVAESYLHEVGDELPGKPLDRALLNTIVELADGGWLLDAGGGPGHIAQHLAQHGARVVGSDLAPQMVAIAARDGSFPVTVADMTALPFRSASLHGIVCFYAVIHLDARERAAVYGEFLRTLRPGGHALIAFHVSDDETPAGGARSLADWWGIPVELTFHFLDPTAEVDAVRAVGFELAARVDRSPLAGVEHASQRCYLLLRKT